jgi:hypothetical protein
MVVVGFGAEEEVRWIGARAHIAAMQDAEAIRDGTDVEFERVALSSP